MTETNNNLPATKGDLALLKTDITDLRTELKTDIAGLRTELKTDIKDLAQKMDQKFAQTDKTMASLGVEVSKTNSRMDRLEYNMMEALRSFKSDLLSAFEASVMKGQMYSQKAMTHGDILSGHEEKLLNHETRLASLESK